MFSNEDLNKSDIEFFKHMIEIHTIRLNRWKNKLNQEPDNKFYKQKIRQEENYIKKQIYKIEKHERQIK